MVSRAKWLGWVAIAALSVAGVQRARASMIEALDLAALTETAEEVILARVVAQDSHYDEHGRIVTDVEMLVEQAEKGSAQQGKTVIVRRLGGVVNGVGMRIEGEPSFVSGERTLLFAQKLAQSSVLRAVGMSQGVLRIVEKNGESWVSSQAAGAALVRRGVDGSLTKAQSALAAPRKLSDVLGQIRTLIKAKR